MLSAGRLWDEAKNLATLERVAPRLPWPRLVAGEDRHPDGGRAACQSVRFLGRLSRAELADWLARASIYALPARYEPFGLSILEAAFAGCALVLGDIPSLREVWGDAACFVPPDDDTGAGGDAPALIRDPDRRHRLAGRARRRAFEYTPARMANGYVAAYRSLLEARGGWETRDGRAESGSTEGREEARAYCDVSTTRWSPTGTTATHIPARGGRGAAGARSRSPGIRAGEAWSRGEPGARAGRGADPASFERAYPGLTARRYDLPRWIWTRRWTRRTW